MSAWMRAMRSMFTLLAAGGLALALAPAPAHAQQAESPGGSEAAKAAASAAGDSAETHAGGEAGEAGEAELDPSKHFNFFGTQPAHLFDYRGKDEFGGPL